GPHRHLHSFPTRRSSDLVWLLEVRRRFTFPALGIAALVVLALVNVDAAASGPDHLRGALNGGFSGVMNVAANRVPLAYARMLERSEEHTSELQSRRDLVC